MLNLLLNDQPSIPILLAYGESIAFIITNSADLNITKITVDKVPTGYKGKITANYLNAENREVGISTDIEFAPNRYIDHLDINNDRVLRVKIELEPTVFAIEDEGKQIPITVKFNIK